MIVYNSILIGIFLLDNLCKKNIKKMYFNIIFFILTLMNCLRNKTIGNDTPVYFRMYKLIKYKVNNDLYVENGYFYFNKILNHINTSGYFLLFICGVIIFISFYKFINKNSPNKLLSLYLFVGLRYFGSTMNIMRQMLAVSIILLLFNNIKESKYKLICLILLAMSFHKSAIVFTVIIFLKKIKYTKYKFYIFNFLSIIIILCSSKLLSLIVKINMFSRYEHYFGGQYFITWNFGSLTQLLISIVVMYSYYYYYIRNKKRISQQKAIYAWICSFGMLFSACAVLGSLLARLALYFTIFYIVIIPLILRKNNNRFIYIGVVIFIFLYHYFTMMLRPEWNYIYPYKFIWN